jgi:ribosome-binding factor A
MPKEFSRTRRVAELLQRELSTVIARELGDPRVGMVTVTAVEVSKDYAHATVYVTRLGSGSSEQNETVTALNRASGFLRHALSERLDLRSTPRLHFKYDTSIERGEELSRLIDRAASNSGENDD